MASRIEWTKIKPSTVRAELVELAVAVGLMAIGWLGLPGLLLAVMAELVVTVALTHRFHPQRGMRRHLADVVSHGPCASSRDGSKAPPATWDHDVTRARPVTFGWSCFNL